MKIFLKSCGQIENGKFNQVVGWKRDSNGKAVEMATATKSKAKKHKGNPFGWLEAEDGGKAANPAHEFVLTVHDGVFVYPLRVQNREYLEQFPSIVTFATFKNARQAAHQWNQNTIDILTKANQALESTTPRTLDAFTKEHLGR